MAELFTWLNDSCYARNGLYLAHDTDYDSADFPAAVVAAWIASGAAEWKKEGFIRATSGVSAAIKTNVALIGTANG